ncbi:GAF domain-containing protein [Zunongwangia endophytica]|uniref:GAF domain-containing protein n=1 Tax=Zunongwangia endophytica TaxID=1808945 RepID=A0ABV8H590_9FLAO|nr:GAF domain-containing protein [Zunongwangia endophytica]MDN3595274.1 PAS domain-containing protein [Zunongwangia endophytica]
MEKEKIRQELFSGFKFQDKTSEKILDELTQMASAICDTPISLISLVGKEKQFFKSKIGLDIKETPIESSFCRYAIENPKEVLIVEDPLNDVRFKNNPLVLGEPYIRFYAGAPLISGDGIALGTLCVIDRKKRELTSTQIKALQILANQTIDYLEHKKEHRNQTDLLRKSILKFNKLSNHSLDALFQLEVNEERNIHFTYINDTIKKLLPQLKPEEFKKNPFKALPFIHADDRLKLENTFVESIKNRVEWDITYRVSKPNGEYAWHQSRAFPDIQVGRRTIWYGSFRDVTDRKNYIDLLEQIIFDISHIMRRPIANMLGLIHLLEVSSNDEDMLNNREIIKYIKVVSEEIDEEIKGLNENYQKIKKSFSKLY